MLRHHTKDLPAGQAKVHGAENESCLDFAPAGRPTKWKSTSPTCTSSTPRAPPAANAPRTVPAPTVTLDPPRARAGGRGASARCHAASAAATLMRVQVAARHAARKSSGWAACARLASHWASAAQLPSSPLGPARSSSAGRAVHAQK